jgi:hypothetical protein
MIKSARMNSFRNPIFLALLLALPAIAQKPQEPAVDAGAYSREATITQSEKTIHIAANNPRPIAQVLNALHLKYGWLIDYEDPRYVSKLDLVDRVGLNGATQTVPAGGTFGVDVPAGNPATVPPPQDKTLQAIVDAYNQSKNPGRFALRNNEDGTYVIVGVAAQDNNGKMATQEAALDSAITIPTAERSATETLDLICKQLGELTHTDFTLGVTPRRLLDYTNVKVGGTKTQARSLLVSTLQATGHPMYWDMLFDPLSKGYYLEIHANPTK